MKEVLEFIARTLVDKPEQVQVLERVHDQAHMLELRVARDDLGKIIGKQGRTARALRTFISAASSKAEKRFLLEIVE